MNNSRTGRYLKSARQRGAKPMWQEHEVSNNPDHKIDQDVPGFPHAPSAEEQIHPETSAEQKTADPDLTDRRPADKDKPAEEEHFKSVSANRRASDQ